METTFMICAAIGGTLIVCQFAMTLFGLGGHHDVGGGEHIDVGGHDVGGDHAVGHDHDSTWFLGVLTIRTVSAGLAFFGLAGLIAHRAKWDAFPTLAIATGAGLGALFLVAWIMKQLVKLNMDGTVRIERALGCHGTVYIPIPADKAGQGKVHVGVLNRTLEYKAVTRKDALPTGAKIVVVAIVGSDTVEVESAHG
ncbi:MAG: hypothetical protein HYX68_13580 [Planctomycetes bacterium]|nr:hypothetical protein [Planctomycetota bacterium]